MEPLRSPVRVGISPDTLGYPFQSIAIVAGQFIGRTEIGSGTILAGTILLNRHEEADSRRGIARENFSHRLFFAFGGFAPIWGFHEAVQPPARSILHGLH